MLYNFEPGICDKDTVRLVELACRGGWPEAIESDAEDAKPVPIRYYRDDSGLEADAIIELSDGRWAAIEVKVGEDKVDDAIKTLNHLEEKVCSNPRAKVRPPEFKMVLVGVSEYARKAGDRLYVVPVRLLGP